MANKKLLEKMNQVATNELRKFLMKYLKEEKKVSEITPNYYNSIIGFIYDVVLDMLINQCIKIRDDYRRYKVKKNF